MTSGRPGTSTLQGGTQPALLLACTLVTAVVLALFHCASLLAQTNTLAERLDALVAKLPAKARIGVAVADARSGQPLFDHHADRLLKPASVLKLFTTAAALTRFGPKFQFETRLYMQGDELWVVGGGDPGLGDERLEHAAGEQRLAILNVWAEELLARGVRSISRIVLDDSVFDRQGRHPDWPAEQADAWYQAPVGGLMLNNNCLDSAARVNGGQVALQLTPALPAEFVVNGLRVGARHAPRVSRGLESDVFEFSGTVTKSDALGPIAVGRSEVFFGHALRMALAGRGVAGPMTVVRRVLPPDALKAATPVAVHRTGMRSVLWRCNTFSQNLFAEALWKALPAIEPSGARSGVAGSWEGGERVLLATLAPLGVALDGASLRDGSGLSHDNRVTAGQIVRLLCAMQRSPHAEAFKASLARPGQDGSMRRRYNDAALVGRLIGKTGSIKDVSALAGYVTRGDGQVLAFAILINDAAPAELAHKICRVLAGE